VHKIYPLILLVLFTSCIARRSDTGKVNTHATLTQSVLIAEASYEAIMTGLGDARRRGDISEDTLERGRNLGIQTYQAVETAKLTLRTYLEADVLGSGPTAEVFKALATVSSLIANLEEFYIGATGSLTRIE
jgi:hypothetical protein